ncbi:OB-fold-containig protein [Sphingobium aquiterrae]|uniref:OB-fold-containig protein n=1 Tax=Sphingobium aquiterrae TaxID=2038656 RepID=UPI003016A6ED
MFAELLTPSYAIFAIAFVVMLGIGTIEAIGLGLGHFDLDNEMATGADGGGIDSSGVLDWLGLRSGLPVLVWFTSLLGCFTLVGIALQQSATAILGTPFHWSIAGAGALVAGLIANGFASAGLARILPEYESTIIDTEDLIMRRGTVLEGAARRGHPARAKVIDQHGQAHYVMIEPHMDGDVIAQGETALLVRRNGPLFFVQPDASTPFRPL